MAESDCNIFIWFFLFSLAMPRMDTFFVYIYPSTFVLNRK